MSKSTETAKTTFPIFSILGVAFIILKLTGWSAEVASWSWLWVLAPFWLPIAIILAFVAVICVFVFIAKYIENK